MTLRIGINGAAGRMGQRLVALAQNDAGLKVVAALEHAAHPQLASDAGTIAGVEPIGVPLASSVSDKLEVMIDFSVPAATATVLATCLAKKIPLVVATTGLDAELQNKIRAAAEQIPVLWAPNMSAGVNLAMKLAETAARALADQSADVEIIERHHHFKEDAPSGTALKFGEIIAGVMGQKSINTAVKAAPAGAPNDEIGYHALRTGDHPGEHTIVFGLMGETLEITIRATNRDAYALGALAAAKFLAAKPPGLYSMTDVLGL